MNLGEQIKEIRIKKKFTQREIADKLGVSQPSYAQYENGKRNPKLETLQKIAIALDVPIWELLGLSKQEAILLHGNDDRNNTGYNINDLSVLIQKDVIHTSNFTKLQTVFNRLNMTGQQEAIKRVEELTEIKKYTDPDK